MRLHPISTLFVVFTLSACGGGGGGDSGSGSNPPTTAPASGSYGWTLRSAGAPDNLQHGLSLVHPAQADSEYVIEPVSALVGDVRLVSGGTLDTVNLSASGVKPYALLYIVDGNVRSLSMQANGRMPADQVLRSGSTDACSFQLSGENQGTPAASRYVVTTKGADGKCGTADDGRAEVRLGTSGPEFTVLSANDPPLGVARNAGSLAPNGWIYAKRIDFWNGTPSSVTKRADSNPIVGVLATTENSALVQDATHLSILNFGSGNTVSETPLDATLTAGTWELIGFDADAFYVYNSDSNLALPWKVLKITRGTSPTVSLLAHGTGLVGFSSLGRDVLYLTVLTNTDNHLLRIRRTASDSVESDQSFPVTTTVSVQTGANGQHLLWKVENIRTISVKHTVTIVNEAGSPIYDAGQATPLFPAEAEALDYRRSENRTRFVFAEGHTATRAFSGTRIVSYDTLAGSLTRLGTLPVYGNDFVIASGSAGPGPVGGGFVAHLSGTSYVDPQAFSFDLGKADSLTITTRR
jgi:hypothetical protein